MSKKNFTTDANPFFNRLLQDTLFVVMFVFIANISFAKDYKYVTYPNDPLNTRIYTLDNGLKVFLTVYKDKPRIQTFIPVRVGSKNDPAQTTGLAHYLEHMLFKGTHNFGTADWTKEGPMIASIDSLFEVYRVTKDSVRRVELYHKIDSISYEASKIAIPNEYDKLMQTIGATGVNAYTTNDNTCYHENIPSNQLENWAKIESERFKTLVLRLFHTELEAVYEEKNRSMTHDGFRMYETVSALLFPESPYGTQTTIGTQEHLKNPSMKNIREFFNKYYVASNMAVILSGDFEYDEAINIIDKYFSSISKGEPSISPNKPEKPFTQPVTKEIIGLEADELCIAFRIDKPANSKEAQILTLLDLMLCNGKTGLIDFNLNQKQRVYNASSNPEILADNCALILEGQPKSGQSNDEVRDLLLEQIELLKQGKFEEWMLQAAINNLKLRQMRQLESNNSRTSMLVNAFVMGIPWEQQCKLLDEMSKITKKDIVDFANKYFKNNYVYLSKKQGTPEDMSKITKPAITPVFVNRDIESKFLQDVKTAKIKEIAPVFVDFNKDMTKEKYKGAEVLYVQNKENKTFNLTYWYPMGSNNNLKMGLAFEYLEYLGTSRMSREQIEQELYKLACSFSVGTGGGDESYAFISGLSENMEKALELFEQLLNDPKADEEILQNLIQDKLKERTDAKTNQGSIMSALRRFGTYGKERVQYILSDNELKSITSKELIDIIKSLNSTEHKILYYGTLTPKNLLATLAKHHKIPDKLNLVPAEKKFLPLETTSNKVFYANYDANQASIGSYTRSIPFDKNKLFPTTMIYNEYFGGSMNSIVFQEIREKRALAYSASSRYFNPSKTDEFYSNSASIGCQNDKMIDAFDAMNELFENMPQSDKAFEIAKEGLKTQIATARITKSSIFWSYLSLQRKGLTYDPNKDAYEALPNFTMKNIVDFNKQYIKGKPKTYFVLARESETDFDGLKKFGNIQKVTLEDIFGY